MRLKKINVSGFKSFVDPTTIALHSNIVGIVGPNGCGKSNVIDAVRWVMGESSAKNLRGESMMDVIFNGSSVRKPVGKAGVELVFDNLDGKLEGAYAQFAEISVKRSLSRDGQSEYFLNKARCRRRDITDIFLGTGLGPRSYSVIEQGMVSRIIEAKPEELRHFVEEAAGISKYKERRRETENRIRHTRENLNRVEDICAELETQLRRLKRQSTAAKRYKVLKAEQRQLQAQLTGLRWQEQHRQLGDLRQKLGQLETAEQSRIADLRAAERAMETSRQQQSQSRESLQGVQAEFYGVGGEIVGVEQGIKHARDKRHQQGLEMNRIQDTLQAVQQQLSEDQQQLGATETERQTIEPLIEERAQLLAAAEKTRERAEEDFQQWQNRWHDLTTASAEPAQEKVIQRSRIEQVQQHMDRLQRNKERLLEEKQGLQAEQQATDPEVLRQEVAAQERRHEVIEQQLEKLDRDIANLRLQIQSTSEEYDSSRQKQQQQTSRLHSLREIQDSALEDRDEQISQWLQSHKLDKNQRLASLIQVEPGWERAADRVLAAHLGGFCVENLDSIGLATQSLDKGGVSILEKSKPVTGEDNPRFLAAYVRSEQIDLSALLSGVQVADDLQQALQGRQSLSGGEMLVTPDGSLVGSNWLSIDKGKGLKNGFLTRAREIESLQSELDSGHQEVEGQQQALHQYQQQLTDAEDRRIEIRRDSSRISHDLTELHNRLGRQESKLVQTSARLQQLEEESTEVEHQLNSDADSLQRAETRLAVASEQSGTLEERRVVLMDEREKIGLELEQSRLLSTEARDQCHQVELDEQRLQSTVDALTQNISRIKNQIRDFQERQQTLQAILAEGDAPEAVLKTQLTELLGRKLLVDERLGSARDELSRIENLLVAQDETRLESEQKVETVRASLQEQRLQSQELVVRSDSLKERIEAEGFTLEELISSLAEDANEQSWLENLDRVERRIDRIGPVNLVAIEEFEEQSERKGYLDNQHADLMEALQTLESVMQKIDRETRSRFRETFAALNRGFQTFFPILFGGGHAQLELTDEDLLNTGVTVVAQPPGKRNSTIHLLSGGEKALTAVSLLFALFDLNPAPFCFLDEVDAPLDDANVERYCQTLKNMSKKTQLLFISHNKITIEMADVLCGVTMSEPGVSRLVDVNIEQALEMAAE